MSSPVLTHLYTPSDFGVLTVYISMLSLLTVIGSLRYETAIPLPEENRQAANLLVLCLLLVVAMSGLTGLAVWLYHKQIVGWTGAPLLSHYLWMLPISLLGAGVYQVLNNWAVRNQAFQEIARTKMSQSIGQVATQSVLGLLHVGTLGLLAGDVIGRMAGSGRLSRPAWRKEQEELRQISWSGMKRMAIRYRRFPLLSGGSDLLNSVGTQITPLLLTMLYGPATVGWYMLADRMLGMPLVLIGSSVAQVYLAEAARLGRDQDSALKSLFHKTVKNMLLLGVPLIGLIALVAPFAFSFVFGSNWSESGVYLQILAPMYLVQFVAVSVSGNLTVTERNDLHLIREIIRILLVTSAMYMAKRSGFESRQAIVLVSLTGTIGYFVHIFFSWLAMRDNKNRKVKDASI